MIQRRQSLYLFLIVIITTGILVFNPVYYEVLDFTIELNGTEIRNQNVNVGYVSTFHNDMKLGMNDTLVYTLFIVGLMSLVSIFLYKRRSLQLRLVIINFIMMLLILLAMFQWSIHMDYAESAIASEPVEQAFRYPSIIPLALFILNYLSARRIRADELLVKSLDRLR